MKMTKSYYENHLLVQIEGEFCANNIHEHRQALQHICDEVNEIVLFDLSQMTHIDSTGISIVVNIHKQLESRNQTIILLGLHGSPNRLFTLLRIQKVISCLDSLDIFISQEAKV